jgi:hypothetical protein
LRRGRRRFRNMRSRARASRAQCFAPTAAASSEQRRMLAAPRR